MIRREILGLPLCNPSSALRQARLRSSAFDTGTVTISAVQDLRFVRATMSRSAGRQEQYLVFIAVRVTPQESDNPARFCTLKHFYCGCVAGRVPYCPHVCSLLLEINELCITRNDPPLSAEASPTDVLCIWLRPAGTELYPADKPVEEYSELSKFGVPGEAEAMRRSRTNAAERLAPSVIIIPSVTEAFTGEKRYSDVILNVLDEEVRRKGANKSPDVIQQRCKKLRQEPVVATSGQAQTSSPRPKNATRF
eukprot:m.248000 g.248000  ORF g.248000 m.248000 type:complete len:251 (-) comp10969_c2_seq3:3015-3767(-)